MSTTSYSSCNDSLGTFLKHTFLSIQIQRSLTCVVNGEIWFAEFSQFFTGWTNQHVVHEERMIRTCTNHTNFITTGFDPIDESIEDVDMFQRVEIVDSTFTVDDKRVFVHFKVGRAFTPPNVLLCRRLANDTLVLWTTARLGTYKSPSPLRSDEVESITGHGRQRSGRDDMRSGFVLESVFVKLGDGEIVVDRDGSQADITCRCLMEKELGIRFVVVEIDVSMDDGWAFLTDFGTERGRNGHLGFGRRSGGHRFTFLLELLELLECCCTWIMRLILQEGWVHGGRVRRHVCDTRETRKLVRIRSCEKDYRVGISTWVPYKNSYMPFGYKSSLRVWRQKGTKMKTVERRRRG